MYFPETSFSHIHFVTDIKRRQQPHKSKRNPPNKTISGFLSHLHTQVWLGNQINTPFV